MFLNIKHLVCKLQLCIDYQTAFWALLMLVGKKQYIKKYLGEDWRLNIWLNYKNSYFQTLKATEKENSLRLIHFCLFDNND